MFAAFLLVPILTLKSSAATITAASCNRTDVSSALNSAAAGDTVLVPAGTCTWALQLAIPSKPLTLQGAGIDRTIIIDGATPPGILSWTTVSTGLHRITGFTFDGNAALPKYGASYDGVIGIHGNSHSFRLDHNKIITERTPAGYIRNNVWGVLDHNEFHLHQYNFGFYVFHDQWNDNDNGCLAGLVGNGCGDASFAAPTNLGTAGAIYEEDNTFTSDGQGLNYFADGWAGMRRVTRFNHATDVVWDAHGTESAARSRGFRSFEIYGNTCDFPLAQSPSAFGVRGGTGVAFSNTCTVHNSGYPNYTGGYIYHVFDMATLRADGCSAGVCGMPFLLCDGTHAWDQNAGPQTGYRCLDQAGAGQTDLFPSPSPGMPNSGLPAGWPHVALEPIYSWNNNILQGSGTTCCGAGPSPAVPNNSVIAENRDYYTTGSLNGMTVGTLALRPATCTPGAGYWATDQGSWNHSANPADFGNGFGNGVLYTCTTSNIWVAFYTPYAYPHPLVTGSAVIVDTLPPAKPAGLALR